MNRSRLTLSNLATRRHALRFGVATAAGVVGQSFWTPASAAGPTPVAAAAANPVARVAHLTDVHVQPEHAGDRGFAACLRHMQAHSHPDLVLFGGDGLFDTNDTPPDRNRRLADLWRKLLRDELSVDHCSAIGNHDVPGT